MNLEKYERQISHPKIGLKGQQQLQDAKVLVVGAGGLGCPVLQYLAAAGIGKIGIVDGDVVTKSNLPRQILFIESDLGKKKVFCAEKYLGKLNVDLVVVSFPVFINNMNAFEIIHDYDVIVDCSDDFATRYLLNDVCVILRKTLVYGAISGDEGQVAVFNYCHGKNVSSNYRDLFPIPSTDGTISTCNETGVIGVLPGTIGILQANEVIKIITQQNDILVNKLLVINLSTYGTSIFELNKLSHLNSPSTQEEFENFSYSLFCNKDFALVKEIDHSAFNEIKNNLDVTLVDVRENEECIDFKIDNTISIPMSVFNTELKQLDATKTLIFICQSGKRSNKAAQLFMSKHPSSTVYSLKNGIDDNQNIFSNVKL